MHCAPLDFISWIFHAEQIFTNSFHGTVFSILFHKQFVVECNIVNGFNNRADSLIRLCKLEDALIENWREENCENCWENADRKIEEKRE